MKVFSVTSNANVSVNDEASLCDDKSAVLVLSWEDHYNLSFIFNTVRLPVCAFLFAKPTIF